jgi:hypothetical protein
VDGRGSSWTYLPYLRKCTLSSVNYDDTGGDPEMDGLEVAIVARQSWEVIVQARDQEVINKRSLNEYINCEPVFNSMARKIRRL